MSWTIERGDVSEVLRGFKDASFDALLSDFPYGLEFQNHKWDYDVPSVETCAELLRVLKPGAPIFAFGGSRTYHRTAVNLEDAGFELCDKLTWIFAKGMPKPATTTDVYIDDALGADRPVVDTRKGIGRGKATAPGSPEAKAWEGHGHALRPSAEDIALACKPFKGSIAHNVLTYGVGPLDLAAVQSDRTAHANPRRINEGCWPANVVFTHAEECGEALCVPWCPVRQLDEQSGERPSHPFAANDVEGAVLPMSSRTAGGLADTGGASRFFFCPKVARGQREAGCEGLPMKTAAQATGRKEGHVGADRPQAGAGRGSGCRNDHPCVKPIELTTWLGKLLRPSIVANPNAVILVPFSGSGSEMIGAIKAGWSGVFGIERKAEYIDIAKARLAHWCAEGKAA